MLAFSLIIPVYNTPYLGEFLNCCMNLDYDLDAFEIIIVDDGSESSFQASYLEYIDLHDELMIHYHYISDKKGNFRVNMARNIGADLAQFDQIIYIDGDSLLPSYYLKNYAKYCHNIGKNKLIIGESIGYNFQHQDAIIAEDIVSGNYQKYLRNKAFEDFRKQRGYTQFWHVFLGGNFCISKDKLEALGGWDETIDSWGEDDIEFAFRAFKSGFHFEFIEGIEVYNIATASRMTREKFYSTMQNQYILLKRYNFDPDYLEYVLQRYHFTDDSFKRDNIPELFYDEVLESYYFSSKEFKKISTKNEKISSKK